MNRREMLAVVGVSGLAATSRAGCGPAKSADNYLELRTISRRSAIPFEVEEVASPGKSIGTVRCDDDRGLLLFLSRTFKDPVAAKQLRLIVATGSTLEVVWAAVKASRAGGFAQVRYFGCLPPGCGIPAGGSAEQTRYDGTVFKTDELGKLLSVNWIKC